MTDTARNRIVAGLALTVVTLVAFWPVLDNDFIVYDDRTYVVDNRHVAKGLTGEGLAWALTATHASNWHPLTWLSHMLDYEVYGSEPRGHHATSLLLHLASTLVLFGFLDRTTRRTGRSAFVAALFAVHPLHVESVAWVAERKDVLSTLLWMLTLSVYAAYVRKPGAGRYVAVLGLFVLGLASKPMVVTLPVVLLLLDFWPLGRHLDSSRRNLRRLVWEKAPLVVLSAASCAVTLAAQHAGGAVGTMERFPAAVRIANAIVSYAVYLRLAIWPAGLAVLYPHPRETAILPLVLSAALLAGVTVFVFRQRRERPYLLVGWLWYGITLVPVIGLVQVGEQAMADRYTYVPLIGIFMMVAWGIPDVVRSWGGRSGEQARHARVWLATASVVVLILVAVTRAQVVRWRDSEALFEHTLSVTEGNWVAYNNLGITLQETGRPEDAVIRYEAALEIRPHQPRVHNNLGNALMDLGRHDEAITHFERALALRPDYARAHFGLGLALGNRGRADEALRHYREAVRLEPDDARMRNNLGIALARRGELASAIENFETAIRLRPGYGRAHANLAGALVGQGRYAEAWSEVENARRFGFEPPAPLIRTLTEKTP